MAKAVKVGQVSDLKPGECKVVEADGKEIGLFNVVPAYQDAHVSVSLVRVWPDVELEKRAQGITPHWSKKGSPSTLGERAVDSVSVKPAELNSLYAADDAGRDAGVGT